MDMPLLWSCPNNDCPPTEFKPVEITSMGDEVPTAVCGGECGGTYPRNAFTRVPAN